MQKVDAIVALVGALVLVGAVGLVAVQDGGRPSSYNVFPQVVTASHAVPLPVHSPGQAFHDEATVELTQGSLHHLIFNVTLTANPSFPTAGSAHVTVTAPNGTTYEAEGAVQQGASSALVTVEVSVAPLPASRAVSPATDEAIGAAMAGLASDEGLGNWTVAVDYAPGLLPAPSVSGQVQVYVGRWAPSGGMPPPPAAK